MQTTFNESAAQATDSLIQSLMNQTNLETLIRFVKILSGEDSVTINDSTYLLLSRNVFHAHNDLAADFLFQPLTRFGLPTYNHNLRSAEMFMRSKRALFIPIKNSSSALIMMICR